MRTVQQCRNNNDSNIMAATKSKQATTTRHKDMERNKQISAIFNKIVSDYLKDLSPAPPEFLYHYSSIDALYEIISNKLIRASNLFYLNDSKEFKLGIDIARELLEKKVNQTLSNNTAINNALESIRRANKCPVYAISFTEKNDDLSQWRGYCPPQGGYSLGFSAELLRSRADALGFILCRCIYEPDEQKRLVQKVIDDAFSEFEKMEISDYETEINSQLDFLLYILPLASLLKNPSFESEAEWRLLSIPIGERNKDIRYRPHRSLLVPYLEFILAEDKQPLRLDKVIIGPNSYPVLAQLSIRGFLESASLEKMPDVELSKSPYRSSW